jgi:hypothetical protein
MRSAREKIAAGDSQSKQANSRLDFSNLLGTLIGDGNGKLEIDAPKCGEVHISGGDARRLLIGQRLQNNANSVSVSPLVRNADIENPPILENSSDGNSSNLTIYSKIPFHPHSASVHKFPGEALNYTDNKVGSNQDINDIRVFADQSLKIIPPLPSPIDVTFLADQKCTGTDNLTPISNQFEREKNSINSAEDDIYNYLGRMSESVRDNTVVMSNNPMAGRRNLNRDTIASTIRNTKANQISPTKESTINITAHGVSPRKVVYDSVAVKSGLLSQNPLRKVATRTKIESNETTSIL